MRYTASSAAVALIALASWGCVTGSSDPHLATVYRDYDARLGFETLYRGLLLASWEALTEDLGARVERTDFDPLRPPVPSSADPLPEHTMTGRVSDLEQLGDVELEVRVSRKELFTADMAGDGGSATVQVRLRIRTSVVAELADDRLQDREFVAQAFWDALDVRLERHIGPVFTAGRPRSSP